MSSPQPVDPRVSPSILSDEILEKAARALCAKAGKLPDLEIYNGVKGWEYFKDEAHAALLAALPDIVEEIAKVARNCFPYREGAKNAPAIASAAAAHIALAIRQLSTNTKGDDGLLFGKLTEAQKKAVLDYDGPEIIGDRAFSTRINDLEGK